MTTLAAVFRFLLRLILRVSLWGAIAVFTIILVRAFDSRLLPDLEPWHTTRFVAEFTEEDAEAGADYAGFLEREKRVFDELESKVVGEYGDPRVLDRFDRRSAAYPKGFPINWNRSFELRPENTPWGAIVLVHGLTDSPYSMRALAEIYRDKGLLVVGPRMPGHGTAPSGLLEAQWQDWLAVVELAADYARSQIGPDAPLLLGGYSNGGSLVMKFTANAIENGEPLPAQVHLFSPAIGITRLAVFAGWHRLLAGIPYFSKVRWESIIPEYDPYKYNSFPKIAGHQSWEITRSLEKQLAKLSASGQIRSMPPLLAFQSLADATVLTSAVVEGLFERLSVPNSELVLFDVNGSDGMQQFVKPSYREMLEKLEADPNRGYTLTVIRNQSGSSAAVEAVSRVAGGATTGRIVLDLAWPLQVYSMTHVAVPFSPQDPIYGARSLPPLALGNVSPRGERGVLRVPIDQFMRLRHNPFFPYMIEQIEDFMSPLVADQR
ncbi:MAG: alpha/beta hydrolase [Gammaproteobacteria bacterium]